MESQSNWRPLLVASLSATEKALDGLPVPAAKTCISLVLMVIAAADAAADNVDVLENLNARYQGLKEFLASVKSSSTADIPVPEDVRSELDNLDTDLWTLAQKWEPRLIRAPRKRDYFMSLIRAQDERDLLKKFLTDTDQRINTFLLHFVVKAWMSSFKEIIKAREAATRAEEAALGARAEALKVQQTSLIASIPRAHYASYKSPRLGGGGPCMENTRLLVRDKILKWALDLNPLSPPLFWLDGVAGIGKTSIALSIAAELDANHHLGGSFLFLEKDDQLKDGRLLFPTLAFQLSTSNPHFKAQLAQVLEHNPSCVTEPPEAQFEKLILGPLSAIPIPGPLILVVDALDECHPDTMPAILWVIINRVKDIPFLRVFITSRPEGRIRDRLAEQSKSAYERLVLHEDVAAGTEVRGNIQRYLKTKLQDIWDRRNYQGEWPSEKDLKTLVGHCGELFIYAATMVHFIGDDGTLDLETQLGALLTIKVGHIPISDSYSRLDQLYLHILKVALPRQPYYIERFQKVVGSIALMQKPLPMEAFARFLGGYDVAEIMQTLYHLHSIIIVPDDPSHAVRTYHLSFPNFITSASRCADCDAYIKPQKQELYLFLRCLDIMEKAFPPVVHVQQHLNIWQGAVDFLNNHIGTNNAILLQDPTTTENDSGVDLYARVATMTPEVRYSNNHWCSHLVRIRVKSDLTKKMSAESDDSLPPDALEQLICALEHFISNFLPQWLDQRIEQILTIPGARRMKPAQDTFDIMYRAFCWLALNIDSQKTRKMIQILKAYASKACARLFPMASEGFNYTLGTHLNPLILEGRSQFRGGGRFEGGGGFGTMRVDRRVRMAVADDD